jgi:hypothetical protein
MSSSQKHRGMHSEDPSLFSDKYIPILKEAVKDLSFLLSRGYTASSSIKTVGDRYYLNERQRLAVRRASCTDNSAAERIKKQVPIEDINGRVLCIDGFNLIITIESAISNGIILECRDGCYRDIASIHGTYRRVEETIPALNIIEESLSLAGIKNVEIYLDTPVSNSGRLKNLIETAAENFSLGWKVKLFNNPDNELINSDEIVATSDSNILDNVKSWANAARFIIDNYIKEAKVISLV